MSDLLVQFFLFCFDFLFRAHVEEVSHFFVLGVHVELVFLVASHLNGFPADDFQSESVQPFDFKRVVRHQNHLAHPEVGEYFGAGSVFAEVGFETEGEIGFHGVHPFVLQVVGFQFIDESDAPSFLSHIEEDAAPCLFDAPEGFGELFAAVAAERAEGVAGEAFGMYPAEDRFRGGHIAFDQRQMMFATDFVDVPVGFEMAVAGGHVGFRDTLDENFRAPAVIDEVGDGNHLEVVSACEFNQLRRAHHRAVLAHDFAAQPALL